MNLNTVTISVVMTTYNGEKYIIEQLQSILDQTRRPDQVVICDDGSIDNTISLISNFIYKNRLENWYVEQNSSNLGWRRNFFNATSKATGDIIFFSDQDDIWYSDKIEIMANLMIQKQMSCLYAEKDIIDAKGQYLEDRQEKKYYTREITQIPLLYSFYDLKTLGCCMCVCKKLAELYQNLKFPEGGHDSQCGRLAVLTGALWHLDQPVIKYRIHGNNTSGISGQASFGQSSKDSRMKEIETSIRWMERLLKVLVLDNEKQQLLYDCLNFQKKRLGFFKKSTPIIYIIRNMKYYRDFSMLCGDVAYKYQVNKALGKLRWRIKQMLNR